MIICYNDRTLINKWLFQFIINSLLQLQKAPINVVYTFVVFLYLFGSKEVKLLLESSKTLISFASEVSSWFEEALGIFAWYSSGKESSVEASENSQHSNFCVSHARDTL